MVRGWNSLEARDRHDSRASRGQSEATRWQRFRPDGRRPPENRYSQMAISGQCPDVRQYAWRRLEYVGGPSVIRPTDDGALPGRRDAVHSGVGDQLAHMFVGMNDDAEVHPIDRGIAAFDLDTAGKFTGLQTRPPHLDRFE